MDSIKGNPDPVTTSLAAGAAAGQAAAAPVQTEASRPAAPQFVSPKVNIDGSGSVSIQIRDQSTGEVQVEFPRRAASDEYTRASALVAPATPRASDPAERTEASDQSQGPTQIDT